MNSQIFVKKNFFFFWGLIKIKKRIQFFFFFLIRRVSPKDMSCLVNLFLDEVLSLLIIILIHIILHLFNSSCFLLQLTFIITSITVWFYGISTMIGYLMPNPVYIIYMIGKHKSTKSNSSKYCYISLTIQSTICLHTVK